MANSRGNGPQLPSEGQFHFDWQAQEQKCLEAENFFQQMYILLAQKDTDVFTAMFSVPAPIAPPQPKKIAANFVAEFAANRFDNVFEIWKQHSNILLKLSLHNQSAILSTFFSIDRNTDPQVINFVNDCLREFYSSFIKKNDKDIIHIDRLRGKLNHQQFYKKDILPLSTYELILQQLKNLETTRNKLVNPAVTPLNWMFQMRTMMYKQVEDLSSYWNSQPDIQKYFLGEEITAYQCLENFKAALSWKVEQNGFIRAIWDKKKNVLLPYIKETLSDKKQVILLNLILEISTRDFVLIAEYLDTVTDIAILQKSQLSACPEINELVKKRISNLVSKPVSEASFDDIFDALEPLPETKAEEISESFLVSGDLFCERRLKLFEDTLYDDDEIEATRKWKYANDELKKYVSGVQIEIGEKKYQIKIQNCLQHFEDAIEYKCYKIAEDILDFNGWALARHVAGLDEVIQSNILNKLLLNDFQTHILIMKYLEKFNNANFLREYSKTIKSRTDITVTKKKYVENRIMAIETDSKYLSLQSGSAVVGFPHRLFSEPQQLQTKDDSIMPTQAKRPKMNNREN